MLIINKMLIEQIRDHGQASYPEEGCGLLLGSLLEGANHVQAVYPVPNRWPVKSEKGYRFRIDDLDMIDAEDAAIEMGLGVIGVFHSHPDHPPIASPRDLAWAAWPGFSYLITEVRSGSPGTSKSWQLLEDRSGFTEEEIIYQESEQEQLPLSSYRQQN